MASVKQTEANRRNAERSTGPKTKRGKGLSRKNATKLGLWAEVVLAPDEDPERYDAFRRDALRDLKPDCFREREEAECIINIYWRLRRCSRIEARLLTRLSSESDRMDGPAAKEFGQLLSPRGMADGLSPAQYLQHIMLLRVEAKIRGRPLKELPHSEIPTDELIESFKELSEHERQSNPMTYDIGVEFRKASSQDDALTKLARRESQLDHQLHRHLNEYRRLVSERKARAAEARTVIDVTDLNRKID